MIISKLSQEVETGFSFDDKRPPWLLFKVTYRTYSLPNTHIFLSYICMYLQVPIEVGARKYLVLLKYGVALFQKNKSNSRVLTKRISYRFCPSIYSGSYLKFYHLLHCTIFIKRISYRFFPSVYSGSYLKFYHVLHCRIFIVQYQNGTCGNSNTRHFRS